MTQDASTLTAEFEAARTHLRSVAYRMLGSATDADDAVQEAYLRIARTDTAAIDNLRGYLTTIVARICLDMLRSRTSRREDAFATTHEREVAPAAAPDHQLAMADSLTAALLVVLETLEPAERLAFVLHDMFNVPFDTIGGIVERTPTAARQLASRARRRIHGASVPTEALPRHRAVVEAFLSALRGNDLEELISVLHPDLVVRSGDHVVHGARAWAKSAQQGAQQFAGAFQHARIALVDGAVGIAMMPNGTLWRALHLTIVDGLVVAVEVVMDPAEVATLDVEVLP